MLMLSVFVLIKCKVVKIQSERVAEFSGKKRLTKIRLFFSFLKLFKLAKLWHIRLVVMYHKSCHKIPFHIVQSWGPCILWILFTYDSVSVLVTFLFLNCSNWTSLVSNIIFFLFNHSLLNKLPLTTLLKIQYCRWIPAVRYLAMIC